MNHPVTLKALARKYAYEAKDDNGKITCYKFTPEELDAVVEATHQAAIEECVRRIVAIEITENGGDYELAQLRYREKVITTLKADK